MTKELAGVRMRSRLEAERKDDSSWSFGGSFGISDQFLCAWANETISEVGGTHCRGFPARNSAIKGCLSVALRNSREAWPAPSLGNGFVECALCHAACGGPGI